MCCCSLPHTRADGQCCLMTDSPPPRHVLVVCQTLTTAKNKTGMQRGASQLPHSNNLCTLRLLLSDLPPIRQQAQLLGPTDISMYSLSAWQTQGEWRGLNPPNSHKPIKCAASSSLLPARSPPHCVLRGLWGIHQHCDRKANTQAAAPQGCFCMSFDVGRTPGASWVPACGCSSKPSAARTAAPAQH